MRRIYLIAAALPILVLGALAQDDIARQINVFYRGQSAVMGPAVKGAPYSAEEVTESTQVLADGTRIHNESKTTVYRDSEGRIRRETPGQITIWDPVAGTTCFLDPKAQTARKVPVSTVATYTARPTGAASSTSTRTEAKTVTVTVNGTSASPGTFAGEKVVVNVIPGGTITKTEMQAGKKESLGMQTMEGVNAEGSRTTSTIEAGAVGNDRPIQIVSERWYSPDLQTAVVTRHNDPRTGEEVLQLTNIRRGEPGAYLFQVPAGYQVVDQKEQK
jgi:hypothetical protein